MAVKSEVKLTTLSYVIIYVPNTKEATAFYRDKLGFKVKMEEEGWVELETGSTTVALHGADDLPAKRDEKTILVFNVEKIKDAYEALQEKGIKFEAEPKEVCATPDHVGMSADFKDPWGNHLSIFAMEAKK
jgi:lactoylglutathione lyase